MAAKRKAARSARVVRRGQRAVLNGKRVIADGKGNWMPVSYYDRYSKDFRKAKPVGKYNVGEDRSTTAQLARDRARGERARQQGGGSTSEARVGTGQPSRSGRGAKAASRSQLARDRARGNRAIAQGSSTSEARVGTGQRTTKPKAAGTKPVQRQTPKPSTKPKATGGGQSVLQKEIAGASKFIETYKGKKGMERAVKQARERLERLRKKKGVGSAQKQTGKMTIRKANRNVA